MDLKPFIARGFPGTFDKAIANVGVAGIDRKQAKTMVRVCRQTVATLYGPEFSPQAIRYRKGSRPRLEAIVAKFKGKTPRARVEEAMNWTAKKVVHPHLKGKTAPDRAMTEEQLIDSGRGWCNEQSRVFVALCNVMEIPARLCYVFHSNLICGHTATEVLLDGRWVFFDVTFKVTANLPDGRPAEGRDLSGPYRKLANRVYRPPFLAYCAGAKPFVEGEVGWCSKDRPKPNAVGDLLAYLGITNYVIKGAKRK